MDVQTELSPKHRVIAYHVIDNIDAFLSKERWLKGGWFATSTEGPDRGFHTECLANFIRRVEQGGMRINGHEEGENGQNYAEATSITERVVAAAIQELYPGEIRHMHFDERALERLGINPDPEYSEHTQIDPAECTLLHGDQCATCRAERYSDEVTLVVEYGPFNGSSGDEVIPTFNDSLGTRYADVQRVIDRARELISGVSITNAHDVMSEQERMEIELQSIDAQAEIDTERIGAWFADMAARGWVKRKLTEREADKRVKRVLKWAEKEKEAIRAECLNCT